MKAVVDGVVALHVPAVVVLVHAVAVDPDDRRMLFRPVQTLRHEQPRRNLLTVGTGIAARFRLDERERSIAAGIESERRTLGTAAFAGRGFAVERPTIQRSAELCGSVC